MAGPGKPDKVLFDVDGQEYTEEPRPISHLSNWAQPWGTAPDRCWHSYRMKGRLYACGKKKGHGPWHAEATLRDEHGNMYLRGVWGQSSGENSLRELGL